MRGGLWGAAAAAALIATPAAAQGVSAPSVAVASTASPAAPTRARHAPGDPLEGVNRGLFSVHETLDRLLFRPIAFVYKAVIPAPLRTAVRHVLSNLGEPVVFVNDVLQLKPKRAVKTAGRFLINSTLGVGGVLDLAKVERLGMPHRSNGFGDTLGRYGVGPGPYLFVPLIGPTDLRDLIGGQADGLVLPLAVGDPFDRTGVIVARAVLGGLDQRVEADADLKTLLGGAADPYATLRSVYLQSRAAEIASIRHGAPNAGALDDPLADPDAAPAPGAAPDAFDSTPADPEPPAPPAPPH